jgi:aconitate hydratase
VVAYALAGRVDIDLTTEPLGKGSAGDVYLKDIWPTAKEVNDVLEKHVTTKQFARQYSDVFKGDTQWQAVKPPAGEIYQWEPKSTYVRRPTYFDAMVDPNAPIADFAGLKPLAMLGDSITTDHISPASSIKKDSPAGKYLIDNGVSPADFNSYGSRRGNHEVMVRGTFANIRLKNLMVPGVEGGYTRTGPDAEKEFIYDVSMRNQAAGVGMMVIAGKEYGSGSSRDWAAKGVALLGVKAVIAESYERIHRSNLVGMGVLPLQFQAGESRETLGLTGFETYAITGVGAGVSGNKRCTVTATAADGSKKTFETTIRIDTPREIDSYRSGGILPYVLRQVAK